MATDALVIPPAPVDAATLPEPLSFALERLAREVRDGESQNGLALRLHELSVAANALEGRAHARRHFGCAMCRGARA